MKRLRLSERNPLVGDDPLAAARGLANACIVAIVFWLVVIVAVVVTILLER